MKTIRWAVRSLSRRPGFSSVAIGTIALAVAATSAMFSVVYGVLLRPLPFPEPDQLVTIDSRASTGFLVSTSMPNYRDWRDRNRVFSGFGASAGWGLVLTGRGPAEVLDIEAVLGDFFGTLGIRPLLGRVPTAAETEPGALATIVLGHGYWQRRFGGDPDLVGQVLVLDERPHVVAGVLPPGVGFPSPEIEGYVPMGSLPDLPWDDRDSGFGTRVFARMMPGVTLDLARRDMDRVGQEVGELAGLDASLPETRSLDAWYLGDTQRPLWILMGAVGFVLLVAVANVGNLLLARGEDRRHELTIRTALGADRAVLIRLLLTEALIIAGAGGVLGALLAFTLVGLVVPFLPADLPPLLVERIAVDPAVLLFTLAVSVSAGLLFGTAPALFAGRTASQGVLRSGARSTDPAQPTLRGVLVIAEVALALVLLVGGALMLRSLDRLQKVDKGFVEEGILTAAAAPSSSISEDRAAWAAYYRSLLEQAGRLPGVRSAALTLLLPLSGRSWELGIHPEGVPVRDETRESVLYNVVSPEYFATLGVPVVRGRAFTAADREGAPLVAIIDQTMADRFWPGQDAIGKRITFETESPEEGHAPAYREVVGIAKNVRHYQLETPSRIQVYVPFEQTYRRWGMNLRIALRTDVPPLQLIGPLRSVVTGLDPGAPLAQVRALDGYVGDALARSRAIGRILAGFAVAGLVLAALGVFGVMSYAVTRRRREIGIRIALGATPQGVLRWIGGRTLHQVATGAALGLLAAVLLSRTLSRLLFEVNPLDPMVYAGVTVVLLVSAATAVWIPARQASQVDPVTVLNEEA